MQSRLCYITAGKEGKQGGVGGEGVQHPLLPPPPPTQYPMQGIRENEKRRLCMCLLIPSYI